MKNRWLSIAIFLVILGIIFYLVNLIVFVPRFSALSKANEAWVEAHANVPMPNPADFGIDSNSIIAFAFLSYASGALLLVGGSYLVILLIARIIRQLGYMTNKEA